MKELDSVIKAATEVVAADIKAVTESKNLTCPECGKYPRDWPGAICVGCAAYGEHTSV